MIAVVTGAGSGVGKHVSLALAREGFSVVLAGRRRDRLEATAREAEAGGWKTVVVETDVSDPASVRTLFDETARRFGRLDLLFNNAGVSAPGVPLEELTVDQWRAV